MADTTPPPNYQTASREPMGTWDPPPSYPKEGMRICTKTDTNPCYCTKYPDYHAYYDDLKKREEAARIRLMITTNILDILTIMAILMIAISIVALFIWGWS